MCERVQMSTRAVFHFASPLFLLRVKAQPCGRTNTREKINFRIVSREAVCLATLIMNRGRFLLVYAFPSAASSRNRRPAAQIALVPLSCVAFSPCPVLTFTVPSSTA
jgi:hypothetical protein